MGGGVSHIMFDYRYVNERKMLRQELIMEFEADPKNEKLLTKIKLVRDIITQNSHICATAARELEIDEDTKPTNPHAAFHELDRLLTIYETSTILKSVQCRIGPVACPLGHYAAYFDDFNTLAEGKKKLKCNICEKDVKDGYHCSYCMYNLCVPCSVVYCSHGHTMKLWTHPESEHECDICRKQNIHSGYRCVVCDIDFCDYCTWKDGRNYIRNIILERMTKDLKYIEDHQEESETALKTITTHRKKLAEGTYATIKELYDFSQSLHSIQEICAEEVKQTRLTRAIIKYRAVLTYGKEYSKTAYEESLVVDNYTMEEKLRLEQLLERHEFLKSQLYRNKCTVGCPLGHGCESFQGIPPTYQSRIPKVKTKSLPDVICKVCKRNASPGNHCAYCEYDLCNSCSVIWCAEGHPMKLWTEPESLETCFLCRKTPILAGYRCERCNVDLCDECTTKEGRDRIRTNWETELNQLLHFMQLNKRLSDIALFYEWRHANQIVSIGLLVDYVKELRTAKRKAEKQIEQKAIIDKIKILRQEIIQHPELNATALRESNRSDIYVFANKQKAVEEMKRLSDILKAMILAQSAEERSKYGIACPLSHGMIPIEFTFNGDDDDDAEVNHGDDNRTVLEEEEEVSESKRGLQLAMSKSVASFLDKPVPSSKDNRRDEVQPMEKKGSSSALRSQSGSFYSTLSAGDRMKQMMAAEEKFSAKQAAKEIIDQPSSLITPWRSSVKRFDSFLQEEITNPVSPTSNPILTSINTAITTVTVPSSKDNLHSDPPATQLAITTTTTDIIPAFSSSNKKSKRSCRVCATTFLNAGHTCTICEYDLCCDCSTVYCRVGHPLRIWTMPEAQSLSCELCKSAPIIAGYRCTVCNIDICDMCTTRESRNAFMLWPRREFHRILDYLKTIKDQSTIANTYLQETENDPSLKEYLTSMSKLCRKLQEAIEIKKQVEREIQMTMSV